MSDERIRELEEKISRDGDSQFGVSTFDLAELVTILKSRIDVVESKKLSERDDEITRLTSALSFSEQAYADMQVDRDRWKGKCEELREALRTCEALIDTWANGVLVQAPETLHQIHRVIDESLSALDMSLGESNDRAELVQKIHKLREALKPFAEWGAAIDAVSSPELCAFRNTIRGKDIRISQGDLRNAAKALSTLDMGSGESNTDQRTRS